MAEIFDASCIPRGGASFNSLFTTLRALLGRSNLIGKLPSQLSSIGLERLLIVYLQFEGFLPVLPVKVSTGPGCEGESSQTVCLCVDAFWQVIIHLGLF